MRSAAKHFIESAVAEGLLTREQAVELGRRRHARRDTSGNLPPIEEVAVALGFLTPDQAHRLRAAQEGFDVDREIGGYRLIEKIGAGTMGTVFKAKQLSLDRVVAIKILNPHLARKPEYVERFLREARAVARLNHPNVISGIDVGEASGVRYFVMEYASGTTVGSLLERGGALDESQVVKIAVQIARALGHAHEADLVHRDIKPDNILITKDGVAKLCDLGLAKDRPEKGRSLGTPNYISPEQAEGAYEVDIRSDLYSFGATLFHMLTGRPPFSGTAKTVMVSHLSKEPPRPSSIDPDVSDGMERIVLKLMRKERAQRYQTPSDLLEALKGLESRDRTKAAQPRAPVRRPVRRRPRR